jgi:hypothetical protein
MPAQSVTSFRATSKLKNGKNGLQNTSGSHSHLKIIGSGFADQLVVNVYVPPESKTPVWTGKTYYTDERKATCHAKVDLVGSADATQGGVGGGDTSVGVTVGDSTPPTTGTVSTGPPLNGTYTIACNGTGGTNTWLAPSGTTGVTLASSSSTAPVWILNLLTNQQGNIYTIQCQISGAAYYLQWANTGPSSTGVSLASAAGAQTYWMLDGANIVACQDSPPDPGAPICPYLSGDVSSGAVTMDQLGIYNQEQWTLGPPPRPHT